MLKLILQFFFFISIISDFDFSNEFSLSDLDILKKLDQEGQDLLALLKKKQELSQLSESKLQKQV
jgi:hypothetical protein